MTRFTMTTAMLVLLLNGPALGQPKDCPWRFVTGHWELTDAAGNSSEVLWEMVDDQSLIGHWEGEDGKATELAGWRGDTKELIATGYGPKGEYWEVVFTTVTKKLIKGKMVQRTPEGEIWRGIWQVGKKSENEMPTLFVGTRNGKQVREEGKFTRIR